MTCNSDLYADYLADIDHLDACDVATVALQTLFDVIDVIGIDNNATTPLTLIRADGAAMTLATVYDASAAATTLRYAPATSTHDLDSGLIDLADTESVADAIAAWAQENEYRSEGEYRAQLVDYMWQSLPTAVAHFADLHPVTSDETYQWRNWHTDEDETITKSDFAAAVTRCAQHYASDLSLPTAVANLFSDWLRDLRRFTYCADAVDMVVQHQLYGQQLWSPVTV